jgi:hypothetical protein
VKLKELRKQIIIEKKGKQRGVKRGRDTEKERFRVEK